MHLTYREWWAVVHGMGLGALFLLAFAGGFAEFWSLRSAELSEKGIVTRTRRLEIGTWVMAAARGRRSSPGRGSSTPGTGARRRTARSRSSWRTRTRPIGTSSGWSGRSTSPGSRRCSPRRLRSPSPTDLAHQASGGPKGPDAFFTASFLIAGVAGALGAFITKATPVH